MDQFCQTTDKCFGAFKSKPFGTRIFFAQIELESFGGKDSIKQPSFGAMAIVRLGPRALHAFLHPGQLLLVGDMHVFRANGSAVGFFQRCHDFGQGRLRLTHSQRTNLEASISIRI